MNPHVQRLPPARLATLAYTGFTLLEVLIAVVIVALGLLSLGALQVRAMRDTTNTYLRSEAVVLATDMADRIRANLPRLREAATAYQLSLAGFATKKAQSVPSPSCLATSPCTPAQLELADTWEWTQQVASRLPGGQGDIALSCSTNPCTTNSWRTWIVTVHWDEARDASITGTNCPAGASDLACLQLRVRP